MIWHTSICKHKIKTLIVFSINYHFYHYISDDSYEYSSDLTDPNVDERIYEFSTGYMSIVGILGVSGNLSVLISFVRNRCVSN